ncbi:unnamed protein product [Coffea canephora]|uniref:Uncharacterized protein n=1 Tax=Coffea canephora TaxID=49390 RepID=A0A068UY40_COFCA|nr:unnamed protein product [Coffea canephora]
MEINIISPNKYRYQCYPSWAELKVWGNAEPGSTNPIDWPNIKHPFSPLLFAGVRLLKLSPARNPPPNSSFPFPCLLPSPTKKPNQPAPGFCPSPYSASSTPAHQPTLFWLLVVPLSVS